jgi:hypothetical protein
VPAKGCVKSPTGNRRRPKLRRPIEATLNRRSSWRNDWCLTPVSYPEVFCTFPLLCFGEYKGGYNTERDHVTLGNVATVRRQKTVLNTGNDIKQEVLGRTNSPTFLT